VAHETAYAYSAMKVVEGRVTEISANPKLILPTHIGVTIMSPEVYPLFSELFDLKEKKDFEGYLFPILARQGKLFAYGISGDCWYPVNNPKEYENLKKALLASVEDDSGAGQTG
jgi:NDP-sugar pyrophosphorylase family protein